MSEGPIHFRMCPCKPDNWAAMTDDPVKVTCADCAPIAAKYQRAKALQAFEETDVAYRNAFDDFTRASALAREREAACEAARLKLDERRKEVIALLGPVEEEP